MSLSIKIFLSIFSICMVVLLCKIQWSEGLLSEFNGASFFGVVACFFGIFTTLILNFLAQINQARKNKMA